METGWHIARDGTRLRWGRWRPASDTAPRGTALLLNGRAEFLEKHVEAAEDLTRRGFTVVSVDWRGQGLSDRLHPDRERGHLETFDVLVADLDEVATEIAGRPPAGPGPQGEPLIVLAHSMGGHVALRWMADHPGRARLAVLVAPMVRVALPGAAGLHSATTVPVAALAHVAVRRGWGGRYALGQRPYRPGRWGFQNNLLTSDPERFDIHRNHFDTRPEMRLGGVTWAWLDAAYKSGAKLADPAYLARIQAPVLICQAGREVLVSNPAQRQLAEQLPDATLKIYREAFHEILMERDTIRDAFWADFDTFLAEHGV